MMRRSDPVELLDRALIAAVPCVEGGLRLEQQYVGLRGRHGHVFDAARNDDELALAHRHVAVPELEQQPAFYDEEQLVLQIVMMPHEFAFDFDELDVAIVELADDLRAPVLGELLEFLGEVYATHARRPPDGLVPSVPSGRSAVPLSVRSCARTGSIPRRRGSASSRRTYARSRAPGESASRAARRSRDSRTRTCRRSWVRRDAAHRYRRCSPGWSRILRDTPSRRRPVASSASDSTRRAASPRGRSRHPPRSSGLPLPRMGSS